MRLTSVTLENFRCFKKETVHLHPQLNVFVGLNASGKTALLEGIACGLSRYLFILFGYKHLIEERDIRQIGRGHVAEIFPVTVGCDGYVDQSKISKHWFRTLGISNAGSDSKEFDKDVRGVKEAVHNREQIELPVLIYFATQRIWRPNQANEPHFDATLWVSKRFTGYLECLARETNTFLFETELDREQKAAQQSKDLGYQFNSTRLDLIRGLAGKVIQDCEIFYFDYEMERLAVMFKDGRRLAIDDLSDGQKSLLLISTGIAFKCATLNPHMGLDAYKSHGVVLIDEVELHLHPDWQRQILPILTREFPNIQFICTTHSPQVVSSLKRENVQVLENFHVKPLPGFVEGRDSNSILSEIFGVEKRPDVYSERLTHFYALLDDRDFPGAKAVLEELEAKWGSMDSEIVRGWLYWHDAQDVIVDDTAEVA